MAAAEDAHRLRIGVLGAARITPPALLEPARALPGVEVAAIAARDPARAREMAAAHGIPVVYPSYAELVNAPDLDAVYVPLPNSAHCEWTVRALDAGKHVLCEKPLASNAAEAERMARVAAETGRVLVEAFHYRYHPLAARVRELLAGGAIGRLIRAEGTFTVPIVPTDIRFDLALAGGATMDLGCYPLQMLRFFPGEEPAVVSARAREGPPGIDVAMEAELSYASGATGRMTCSMEAGVRTWAAFEARGDRGTLRVVNPLAPHIGHQLSVATDSGERAETVPGDTTYLHQLRAFAAAVRGSRPAPTDAAEGVANMRLIDAVYRKAGFPLRGA